MNIDKSSDQDLTVKFIVVCQETGYVWEKKSKEDAEYEVKAHFERYGHHCIIEQNDGS